VLKKKTAPSTKEQHPFAGKGTRVMVSARSRPENPDEKRLRQQMGAGRKPDGKEDLGRIHDRTGNPRFMVGEAKPARPRESRDESGALGKNRGAGPKKVDEAGKKRSI